MRFDCVIKKTQNRDSLQGSICKTQLIGSVNLFMTDGFFVLVKQGITRVRDFIGYSTGQQWIILSFIDYKLEIEPGTEMMATVAVIDFLAQLYFDNKFPY